MSVLKPPQRRSCPAGREGHRYWSSEEWSDETCHLDIEWEENGKNVVWEVSFVDTVASMNKWMDIYAQDVLMFDCEWSKKNGVGVIQFATPPELHQVLVVDCTRVTLAEVRNLFERCKMVGWATGNDIRHLNLDTSGRNVVDLQELTTQNSEFWANWKEEDSIRVEEYQPLDRHGNPHQGAWGLDDMAQCFLGHTVKVSIHKHPKWSEPTWKFKDIDIHYAANDVISVAYIYNQLKYMYEPIILF